MTTENRDLDQTTCDSFFNGNIKILQPANGYRFSIDSVILASLATPPAGTTVLDLGTGCGIIPLILAYREPTLRFIGIELQSRLAALATENIELNGMQDRISILCQDICTLSVGALDGIVDYAISNPPYRPVNSGRINPDPQKALARHELAIDLSQLLKTARNMLRSGGRFILIYPAERLTDLICQMRKMDIEPKKLCIIFSIKNGPAKLVVLEGVRAGRPGIQDISSLVIYRSDGRYTPQMAQMFKI